MTKTIEPCSLCRNPNAICEHGVRDGLTGSLVHLWTCPGCGGSTAFVGYHCPDCQVADLMVEVDRLQAQVARWQDRARLYHNTIVELQRDREAEREAIVQ